MPYRLTSKQTRAVGSSVPRVIYEQVFRSDVWDRGTPQASEHHPHSAPGDARTLLGVARPGIAPLAPGVEERKSEPASDRATPYGDQPS